MATLPLVSNYPNTSFLYNDCCFLLFACFYSCFIVFFFLFKPLCIKGAILNGIDNFIKENVNKCP